jgi:carbonic anhydrase
MTSFAEEFLEAHRRAALAPPPSGLAVQPARRLAIVTCMDSRYTAQGVLGLQLGDAHVIRNAGGRVTDDVIRSLVLSAGRLGTRRCILIHHTNCGLHGSSNEQLRAAVAEVSGVPNTIDFIPFDDVDASVREDVALLRACPHFPPGYDVVGFVYDVVSGDLRPVE